MKNINIGTNITKYLSSTKNKVKNTPAVAKKLAKLHTKYHSPFLISAIIP